MKEYKVPVQSLIDHIKTATDVDPWAKEMAEELLKEQEARWISVPHKRARICSHCEADEPYKFADDDAEVYEYCPHCGAKMTESR